MSSTSSNLYLLSLTDEDVDAAVGEDYYTFVRGNRKSAKLYLRKNLLRKNVPPVYDNDAESTWLIQFAGGGGYIPVGGGLPDKDRPILTCTSKLIQTDEADGVFVPIPSSFFEINEGVLTARPRNIQLARPIYLEEAVRPGHRFKEGRPSQTHLTLSTPDLLPLTAAVDSKGRGSKNNPPRVKLNLWAPDKRRLDNNLERDTEWLKVSSSDSDIVDNMKTAGNISKQQKRAELDSYCKHLMESLNLLFWFMKIGGRWPLTAHVVNNCVHFKLKMFSWNYIFFVITSLIYAFITVTSIYNTFAFIFLAASERGKVSQTIFTQVERLEFDKYWHYVFWTHIMSVYVCFWNLALLVEDTILVQNLLNRWSYAVTQMHYKPTVDIRKRTIWAAVGFGLYATGVSIFCFTDLVNAASGSAGVIGVLFVDNVFRQIRFTKYFFYVRCFGLAFHLYTIYSSAMSLLFIVTCVKLVENSAKNWNLRFAIRFGMLSKKENGKTKRIVVKKSDIPMPKLLLEHRLITSFARQTADAFHAALNVYLVTTGTEMVLFLYRAFAFILIPDKAKFNESGPPQKIGESGDTIRYRDTEAQRQLSCFIMTGYVIIAWFSTCRNIAGFGEAISDGFKFVSRHGLILCRNAKERNFIQSLNMQFSPVLEFSMKAGSMINRPFILSTFVWVLVFALGLLSFFPFNLQKSTISFCGVGLTGELECQTVSISRGQRRPAAVPPAQILEGTTTRPRIMSSFLRNITCNGTALGVNGIEIGTTVLTLLACDEKGATIFPFDPAKCFDEFSQRFTANPSNSPPYSSHTNLYDCNTGDRINDTDRDDCGNLRLGNNTEKVPLQLFFKLDEHNTRSRYVCCFRYGNITEEDQSFRTCHAQSPIQQYITCYNNGKEKLSDLGCLGSLPTSTSTTTTPTTRTPTTTTPTTTTPTTTTPTTTMPTTTTPTTTTPTTTTPTTTTLTTTTTTPTTTTTTMASTTERTVCNTTWIDPVIGPWPQITQVLTHQLVACDINGREIPPYGNGYCAEPDFLPPYSTQPRNSLFECDTGKRIVEYDDCGNIQLRTTLKRDIKLLYVDPTLKSFRVICASCFSYGEFGREIELLSVKFCHMQSQEQAITSCKGPDVSVSDTFPYDPVQGKDIDSSGCPAHLNRPITFECLVDHNWATLQGYKRREIQVLPACIENINGQTSPPEPAFEGMQDSSGNILPPYTKCYEELPGQVAQDKARPYTYKNPSIPQSKFSCMRTIAVSIDNMERDSCGNLAHALPGLVKKVPIVLKLRKNLHMQVCCYDYKFLRSKNDDSLPYCHMRSEQQALAACNGTTKPRSDPFISGPDHCA